jgi:hypothetical protein
MLLLLKKQGIETETTLGASVDSWSSLYQADRDEKYVLVSTGSIQFKILLGRFQKLLRELVPVSNISAPVSTPQHKSRVFSLAHYRD